QSDEVGEGATGAARSGAAEGDPRPSRQAGPIRREVTGFVRPAHSIGVWNHGVSRPPAPPHVRLRVARGWGKFGGSAAGARTRLDRHDAEVRTFDGRDRYGRAHEDAKKGRPKGRPAVRKLVWPRSSDG